MANEDAHVADKVIHHRAIHIASGDLWAGAEAQLFTLAKEQSNALGIMVTVVLFNHGTLEDKLHNAGISTIVLDESKYSAIWILSRLIQIIRNLKPDIIHTHRLKENILGSIAGYLAGRTPSLRTVHGAPEYALPWYQLHKRLIHWLDWFCGRYLQSRVIAVSEDIAQLLQKDFADNRIRVVENGIDLGSVLHKHGNLAPASYDANKTFRIGLVGRMVPVKRVDLFIQTAAFIHTNFPDLHASFHVFGDGPLRKDLAKLVHDLEIDEIVHLEGHSDDIYQSLDGIHLLLMTSDHEGLPMALLEAMALGIPVIAHAVGGIPKLLDDGACGILVHDHSSYGYAHEIYKLLRNPDISTLIVKNAMDRVRAEYSAVRNAQAILLEYIDIIDTNDLQQQ